VRKFDALGVATFGPVDCQPSSPTYGFITTTPKPGWHMTDVLSAIKTRDVPTFFDTDVNAPALAEFMLGNTPKNGLLPGSCIDSVS
jgi:fructokinase